MKTTIIRGRVYTGRGFAEAVAFKDGLVTETGSFEQLKRLHGDAEVMDFGQCSVLPGFIDSHLHMYNLGVSLRSVQLHGANSIAECIERGKKYIKDYNPPKNTVISGRGWNDDYFLDERRMLTRRDLDLISTEYPIVFTRACGHALTANTRAIELAGVTKDTPQPDGGQFEIGEDGLPNGIFKENASAYIKKIIKEPDLTETKAILKAAMDNASSWGITSVQTNDLHENNYSLIWQAYESLANEGKATVRAYQQCNFTTIEGYKKFLSEGFSFGMGSDMNKIGPLKLFIDGSLGARTALMRNEYSDMPGTYGIRCLTDFQLDEFVKTAVENNMQVIVHAIGDGGIEAVLDSYDRLLPEGNPLRCGIVHCQITDLPLLKRFAQKNVYALVQPIFLHYDMHIAADRVGEELASSSYAFGTMDALGIKNSYGTDCPVEALNTMDNLYCAVTRKDLKGFPQRGWLPQEAVGLEKAIEHYTQSGAENSFEENKKGLLLPGYFADIAVLNRDIFSCTPDEIKGIKVMATILGGKTVYRA